MALIDYFTMVDVVGNPPPPYELSWKIGVVDGFAAASQRRDSSRLYDDRCGQRGDDVRDKRGSRDRSCKWHDTLR